MNEETTNKGVNSVDKANVLMAWAAAVILICLIFCVSFGTGPACRISSPQKLKETTEYAPYVVEEKQR